MFNSISPFGCDTRNFQLLTNSGCELQQRLSPFFPLFFIVTPLRFLFCTLQKNMMETRCDDKMRKKNNLVSHFSQFLFPLFHANYTLAKLNGRKILCFFSAASPPSRLCCYMWVNCRKQAAASDVAPFTNHSHKHSIDNKGEAATE